MLGQQEPQSTLFSFVSKQVPLHLYTKSAQREGKATPKVLYLSHSKQIYATSSLLFPALG